MKNIFPKRLAGLLAAGLALICGNNALAAGPQTKYDDQAAVIFVYQRIGEDQSPSTNIRVEQFAAHIRELTEDGYTIKSLPDIIAAFKKAEPLPPKTVAITFDGGFKSILHYAVPLLEEEDIPYTLFVSTNSLDQDSNLYLNWDDLKNLKKNPLVSIGLHPASYSRLYDQSPQEIRRQVNNARARLREMLNIEARFFAYPFGEYSKTYHDIIAQQGFEAAFGQESGVAYAGADAFSLPRFTLTDLYADTERFRMLAGALPLPVTDIEPTDPHIMDNPPAVGFTISEPLTPSLESLSCFASGQEKPDIQILGDRRVELRLHGPFDQGRVRINCTMPAPPRDAAGEPVWRWMGMLLTVPDTLQDVYPASGDEENEEE